MPHPFERYRDLVDDWEAFLAALDRPLPVCVWANTLRIDPEAVSSRLEAGGLLATPLAWRAGAFRLSPTADPATRIEYLAGAYHIQEEASLLPVRILAPRPGERVLDLCAAPGNKTAELAVAMQNTGTIVANDVSRGRLNVLRMTLDRLGLLNVSVTCTDAAGFPLEAGPFDRIVCDVPCSCEGTVRKHPGVLAQSGGEQHLRLHRRQRAILARALHLLRPGGRVVYATCTFAPEENEMVVAHVLERFGEEVEVLPIALPGLKTTPGLTRWGPHRFPEALLLTRRLWPHHQDTGGFYVALLQKKGAPSEAAPAPALAAPAPLPEEVAELSHHFGLPVEAFAGVSFYRPNKKYLSYRAAGHHPPVRPEPVASGLFLLKTTLKYPKLTTQAAQHLGPFATKNVLHLDREQLGDYLSRTDVSLPAASLAGCTVPGYVLIRHDDLHYGVGFLKSTEQGAVLQSLFPRTWAGITASASAG